MAAETPSEVGAYHRCIEAARKGQSAVEEVIKTCSAPAEEGIPGAQHIVGVFLVNRNASGDRGAGVAWLEKAVSSGHPAAAYALATVYLQYKDDVSATRGRDLLRFAVCSGYPAAVGSLAKRGLTIEKLGCSPSPETNFSGEWFTSLKWTKEGTFTATPPELKLSFSNDSVKVFMKAGEGWREIKPGSFKILQRDETMSVSSLDSGWDYDGKWIESWKIELLRTGADDAVVTFLRSVNNPHMPATLSWRTFTTVAEGTAHRRLQ